MLMSPETTRHSHHGDVCGLGGSVQTQHSDGTSATMSSPSSVARTRVDKDSWAVRILEETAATIAVSGGEIVQKGDTVPFGDDVISNVCASGKAECGDGGSRNSRLATNTVETKERQHAWCPPVINGWPTTATTTTESPLWCRRWQRSPRPSPPGCVPGGYTGHLSVPHVRRRRSYKDHVRTKGAQQQPLQLDTLPSVKRQLPGIVDLALASEGDGRLNHRRHSRAFTPRRDVADSGAVVGRVVQSSQPRHQHGRGMLLVPTRPSHAKRNTVLVPTTTTDPECAQGDSMEDVVTGTIEGGLRDYMIVVGGTLARRWTYCSTSTADNSARRRGRDEIIRVEGDGSSGDRRRRKARGTGLTCGSSTLRSAVVPPGRTNLMPTNPAHGKQRTAMAPEKNMASMVLGVCAGPSIAECATGATGAAPAVVVHVTDTSTVGTSGTTCLADGREGKVETNEANESQTQRPEAGKVDTKPAAMKVGFYSHLWAHTYSPDISLKRSSNASSRGSPASSLDSSSSLSSSSSEGSTKSSTKSMTAVTSERAALNSGGGFGGGDVDATTAIIPSSPSADHVVDGKAEEGRPGAAKVAVFARPWAPRPTSSIKLCSNGPSGGSIGDHRMVTPAARVVATSCSAAATEYSREKVEGGLQTQEGKKATREEATTSLQKLVGKEEKHEHGVCTTTPNFFSHLWRETSTSHRVIYTPPTEGHNNYGAVVHPAPAGATATGNDTQQQRRSRDREAPPRSHGNPCDTGECSGSISRNSLPGPLTPQEEEASGRRGGNGGHLRALVAAAAGTASYELNGSVSCEQRPQEHGEKTTTTSSDLSPSQRADGSRHRPETAAAGDSEAASSARIPLAARTAEGNKGFFAHLWEVETSAKPYSTATTATPLAMPAAIGSGGSDYHFVEERDIGTPMSPQQQNAGGEEEPIDDGSLPPPHCQKAVGEAPMPQA